MFICIQSNIFCSLKLELSKIQSACTAAYDCRGPTRVVIQQSFFRILISEKTAEKSLRQKKQQRQTLCPSKKSLSVLKFDRRELWRIWCGTGLHGNRNDARDWCTGRMRQFRRSGQFYIFFHRFRPHTIRFPVLRALFRQPYQRIRPGPIFVRNVNVH